MNRTATELRGIDIVGVAMSLPNARLTLALLFCVAAPLNIRLAAQATSEGVDDETEAPIDDAEPRAAEFQRVDRKLGSARFPEVEVHTGRWYGDPLFADPALGIETSEPDYIFQVGGRTNGFSEAAVVLPAATRRDGTRMPPTCVFSLPHDGRGSLWFLTPKGLALECLTPTTLGLNAGVTRFGTAVESGPDLDGDGIEDLIVTGVSANGEHGSLFVVSIAERLVLFQTESLTELGLAACVLPDQDGDTLEDLAILSGPKLPHVTIISTNDGSVLRTLELQERMLKEYWRPDFRLRVLPQTDSTAPPLLLVSIPGTSAQELAVLDLATNEVRWSANCDRQRHDERSHWCGYSSVIPTEDLDGDGTAELLAAGVREHQKSGGDWSGYSVISGASGESLRTVEDIPYHSGGDGEVFVTDYPDVDGDGFREHIVASTTVFSRDLVLFSGRTGEPLYQIDIGELPYEYSNDIQAQVDWDGDGTNDLVLHDTDVWAEGTEQQLIVLSMADHEILHYLRPRDLEYAIAVREGWTVPARSGASATTQGQHALDSHRDPEEVILELDATNTIRVGDACEPSSEHETVAAAPVSAELDYGTALAVIPAATQPDGKEHTALIAVGLPSEGLGTVCLLSPDSPESCRAVSPEGVENLCNFGEELLACHDVDGDGVRDLLVKARHEDRENRRLFVVSTKEAKILYELDSVSSNAAQPNACCVIPDRDADGIDDFAVLAIRSGWQDGGGQPQDCVLFHSASSRDWGITVLGLKQQGAAVYGRPVHLHDAQRTHGQLVLLAGDSLHSFDLATERPTWSRLTQESSGSIFLDAIAHGDADGDGVDDLLLAVSNGHDSLGRLELRSGNSGDIIRVTEGVDLHADSYGALVSLYVDIDGDGFRELLLTNGAGAESSVLVLSGQDGSLLQELVGSFAWGKGRFIDGSVDWDGKGLPDLVLGASAVPGQAGSSGVCIISMEDHCVLELIQATDLLPLLKLGSEERPR